VRVCSYLLSMYLVCASFSLCACVCCLNSCVFSCVCVCVCAVVRVRFSRV